jgi:hypothetical protein
MLGHGHAAVAATEQQNRSLRPHAIAPRSVPAPAPAQEAVQQAAGNHEAHPAIISGGQDSTPMRMNR